MNSKALCGILMLVAGTAFCASTKEINFSFDPSRFTTEKKGDAVLFRYNDPRCKYVEHGAGAPVLPCIEVYVVMPKGATYTKCRTRVESLPLAGTYTLYTRESNADVLQYAKRYPERLVEYAGRRALGEYTLFTFRVYPMSCQPGDGSVARTLRVGLVVEYETADKGKYETVTAEQIVKVKSLVLNP
ncbi:hypothetical protein GX586_10300, partial [bacterium]|nr:hypothetical protein [bacterium]